MCRWIKVPIVLLFMVTTSCYRDPEIPEYEGSHLVIRNIFPGNTTTNIATDTFFTFKYNSAGVKRISIQISSDSMTTTFYLPLTATSGYIGFQKVLPPDEEITVRIRKDPPIINCNPHCDTIEEYLFTFTTGNTLSSDPPVPVTILPCQHCFYYPKHYEILFSKPLSDSTVRVLRDAGYKVFMKDDITLYMEGAIIEIPPFLIGDIYGRKITGPIRLSPRKPCLHVKEICIHPRTDWNDSRGGNRIPFDGIAGYGTISSSDQFIMVESNCNYDIHPEALYISICDSRDSCEYQGFIPGSGKNYTNGKIYIFGDPPGTIAEGDRITLYYDHKTTDETTLPDLFTPMGGWWRESATYNLLETECTIP